MATGQRPFHSGSILQLYETQRAGVKLKPRDLRPCLPEAAQAMILKALSFSPQDRFTNAKDFTDALAGELTGGSDWSSPPDTSDSPSRWSLILTLAVVAVIGILAFGYFRFRDKTGPKQAQTTAVVTSDRLLSYSIEARRDPRRYPRAKPFSTFENAIFGTGDEIRFYISSPQSGNLYVINEGPMQTDGLPNFNILFPEVENDGGSPEIRAGQVAQVPPPGPKKQESWFVFDDEEGVEHIWLVWSERVVPELEAVKGWANTKDNGAIRDLTQRASVSHYLTPFSAIKPEVERIEVSKHTKLKVRGGPLVWRMKLEHR
jgi:serine/threonine protein kinase